MSERGAMRDHRLFLICRTCGDVQSMAPEETETGGDAHHYVYNHTKQCEGARIVYGILRYDQINEFYDKTLTERVRMLASAE